MLKTGIYTPDQTPSFSGRPRAFIALDLYDQFSGNPELEMLFQEQAIGRVAVANGSFKKTHLNRFDEFDEICRGIIIRHVPVQNSVSVHDMAVSDGRTSVPFFEFLSGHYGQSLSFLASDYSPGFKAVYDPADSNKRLILDHQNRLIQIVAPPFVFQVVCPESGLFYPVNRLYRHYIQKKWAQNLYQSYLRSPSLFQTKDILILCRACQNLTHDSRFSFDTYDVLSGIRGTQQIIRAMNILNISYFAPDQMAQAVSHICGALAPGGLLITGSNGDGGTDVRGGVYKKTESGMIKIHDFSGGSPAESLILQA
ncbi:MAG: hypothetical protein J0L77_03770 [Alphaproteobacteria bacterium]|nr:hypothetical protein [Alphaproteobacteria bacterium]